MAINLDVILSSSRLYLQLKHLLIETASYEIQKLQFYK